MNSDYRPLLAREETKDEATNLTPFMRFWQAINDELATKRLPALLYGEANDVWLTAKDTARIIARTSGRV